MNTLKRIFAALPLMAALVVPAQASDTDKEQRWADQIVDALIEGEPHWLQADGQRFLAIYTPAATANPIGTAILLHGMGAHPDWPQVINPLRMQLPEEGWATLSLQMPILPNEAKDTDYIPLFKEVPGRIKAGIDFLQQQGGSPIVLIGHSLGATMGTYFLANMGDPKLKAFTGIGMSGDLPDRVLDNVISLRKIQLPVLDIYGSHSDNSIVNSAQRRADALARAGNSKSRQIKIKGSGHFYRGYEPQLLETITTWLAEAAGE